MKIIKTRSGIKIEVFDNPTEPITVELVDNIMNPINQNKLSIFNTVSTIELLMDGIIKHYFYGTDNFEYKEKFEALILSSDWCSFSAKRKLVLHFMNDLSLLDGPEKNEYDILLKKAMSYRNAFAHGELSTDGRLIKLAYFEGKQKQIILDDNYFNEVELNLNKCFEFTNKVAKKIGSLNSYNESETN